MFQALAIKKGVVVSSPSIKKGPVVRDNFKVIRIEKGLEGGIVVKMSSGDAKCIVAVGVWASKLLSPVDVELPIQPLPTPTGGRGRA